METERFKQLKDEFRVLAERWKAAPTLEERLALNEKIMNILDEAQGLLEQWQNEMLRLIPSPRGWPG